PEQRAERQRPLAGVGLQRAVGVERGDGLLERVAADEPHRVIRAAVAGVAQAVDGDDPGVLQAAGALGLDQEPGPAGGVVGSVAPAWGCNCLRALPSRSARLSSTIEPRSMRSSDSDRPRARDQAEKAATSWSWSIRPVCNASKPKRRSRGVSSLRAMGPVPP